MTDDEVLKRLIERCEVAGLPVQTCQAVLDRYREPWRVYHGVKHIVTLYRRTIEMECALQDHQVLALLFHDAVYQVGSALNEEMSAKLFERYASNACMVGRSALPPKLQAQVMQTILDTKGHVSTTPSSRIVLDLDLSGLGQSEEEFEQDSLDVFAENRHLVSGWEEYVQKRGAFFEGLLERRGGRVFQTKAFAALERQAQSNLARAIDEGRQAAPLPRSAKSERST